MKMDDLIYLIVLIAWVLFAFYRKSQKKKQPARPVTGTSRPPAESSQLPTLEEILMGEPSYPEPEPEFEPAMSDGMSPVIGETSFEKEYNKKGIRSIEEMDIPFYLSGRDDRIAAKNDILLEEDKESELEAKVNLRQAVIYAEILNRPYA